jgi:hypothetical protein
MTALKVSRDTYRVRDTVSPTLRRLRFNVNHRLDDWALRLPIGAETLVQDEGAFDP